MSALILEALTTHALREHLDWAERQADLAQFIDDWSRSQREQKYWLAMAAQIKAEIKRRADARQARTG